MLPDYLKPYASQVTFRQYKESRNRRGIPNAKSALQNAAYNLWARELEKRFLYCDFVRIEGFPDYDCDLDFLLGDTYCPKANPDIKPEILEREREAYIDRINRDGVWGYVSQWYDGEEWHDVGSIWGFVGDDFTGSGYDHDLMEAALDALDAHTSRQARAIEGGRPDLYAIA